MALFGASSKLERCLWFADLASWPNPDSPQGQNRRENCFDRHMRGAQPTIVNSGNGKYALTAGVPVRQSATTSHVSPWSPVALVRPPMANEPAGSSQPEGDNRGLMLLVGIVAIVAILIYRA